MYIRYNNLNIYKQIYKYELHFFFQLLFVCEVEVFSQKLIKRNLYSNEQKTYSGKVHIVEYEDHSSLEIHDQVNI
jgi:hypothetical protein